jgi:NADPH:quinone reductase-like Zn-dependent oxidoreductase
MADDGSAETTANGGTAETMDAVGFHEHGPIDNFELLSVPVPEAGPEEVLVDVHAASLNHQDLFAIRELEHYVPEYPFWGGGDFAGEIAAVGERVEGWEVGDRVAVDPTITCGECRYCEAGEQSMCAEYEVFGEHRKGGFAEYAAVPRRSLIRVPDGVAFETAAAAPMVTGTAFRALLSRADLEPYEDLLVVGATGGVGHMAVQIATEVVGVDTLYGTTSTDEKAEFLRDLGVDHVIDYTEEDFDSRVWELTGGEGVDVAYNNAGGETWVQSMRALGTGGRLVTSGATAGPNPETELRLVFVRQLEILGSTAHSSTDLRHALEYVWDGTVEPVVQETFSLADYEEAFRTMDDREAYGKLVFAVE